MNSLIFMVYSFKLLQKCQPISGRDMSRMAHNGSLSNNLLYIPFYLDTYPRKISNIRFSEALF